MEAGYYIIIYLLVALIITIVFNIEPLGSVLWGLFPIIIPISYIKFILKKKHPIKIEQSPNKIKPMRTFESFINDQNG